MTYENQLKECLDQALKYVERENVNSETAKKYRAAAKYS